MRRTYVDRPSIPLRRSTRPQQTIVRLNPIPSLSIAEYLHDHAKGGLFGGVCDIDTVFGIGQATAWLCRAILTDARARLPLSVGLKGEYGLHGINCGVPCVVGRRGIERIIELPLTETEREALLASADMHQAEEWIDDRKCRASAFRQILQDSLPLALLGLIRCICQRRDALESQNKRLANADREVLMSALHAVTEEFSFALSLPRDEVTERVANALSARLP